MQTSKKSSKNFSKWTCKLHVAWEYRCHAEVVWWHLAASVGPVFPRMAAEVGNEPWNSISQ